MFNLFLQTKFQASWTIVPVTSLFQRIPQKQLHATAGAFIENKIYVIGGCDGTQKLNSVDCLDMSENDPGWLPIAPMHRQRQWASACTYQGNFQRNIN